MNGRPELEAVPIRDNRNMSPRSTLDIDRERDEKKSDKNHEHKSIPRVPIKKVSFTASETITNNTEHTDQTILTIKEELDLYNREDDVEHDYDCGNESDHECDCDDESEHEYDDEDEEAEHDYGDEDDILEDQNKDYNYAETEDHTTSTSPIGVVEGTSNVTIKTFVKNATRRKIRWSSQVRVQEIRHLNNMSEAEREAVWMSPIDYKMIKNMAKTTVLMMMAGEHIGCDDPDFCTRGLEFRTRKGNKIRSANKLRARSAVLNEQDLQRDEGFHDPEFIAMASLDVSYECREQAQKRGDGDAQAILTYVIDVPREVSVVLF